MQSSIKSSPPADCSHARHLEASSAECMRVEHSYARLPTAFPRESLKASSLSCTSVEHSYAHPPSVPAVCVLTVNSCNSASPTEPASASVTCVSVEHSYAHPPTSPAPTEDSSNAASPTESCGASSVTSMGVDHSYAHSPTPPTVSELTSDSSNAPSPTESPRASSVTSTGGERSYTHPNTASLLTTASPPTASLLTTASPPTASLLTAASPPTASLLTTDSPPTAPLLTTASPPTASLLTTDSPPTASLLTTASPPTASLLTTDSPPTLTTDSSKPASPVEPSLSLSDTVTDRLRSFSCTNNLTQKSKTVKQQRKLRVKCPHCFVMLHKKNLKVHNQRKHGGPKDITAARHYKSVLIDKSQGLYAVKKTSSASSLPVHVQRKTWGLQQVTACEVEECRRRPLLTSCGGLSDGLCDHLRSIHYCSKTATEEQLQPEVLHELLENRFISESRAAVCKQRQQQAEEARVPLCVTLDFYSSKTKFCFSVHEPALFRYSTLGRVIVTYSVKYDAWRCPCSKAGRSCPHVNVATWLLYQSHRDLYRTAVLGSAAAPATAHTAAHSHSAQIQRCVRYVYENKKIPVTLPEEVKSSRAMTDYPHQLIPAERTCQMCPGSPELGEAVRITDRARIVGMGGVMQDISTYNRRCPQCRMMYRYQEWRDGLHNFNDRLILTLRFCLYLRENLQNHVTISRVISCLQALDETKFPSTGRILHGYCHFEALCDAEYSYSCINCGFYPPVVLMDVFRKGLSHLEVSELQQPGGDFSGEHDVTAFWESVHLHMISRGFFDTPSQNPFVVKPSYENWAPWIGRDTRRGDAVLNTEFEKEGLACDPEDELTKRKVSAVRKLCKAFSLDSQGSRLRGERRSRQEASRSTQRCSGGWSVVMCPHGVVYSLKFNLRAEGPRDFTDLLLSWKHLPNVCVYERAGGLAAHANARRPDDPPFQPFEGRLAESTRQSVEAAAPARGSFRVSLPWLAEKLEHPEANGHPMTGSSRHYVLQSHQGNAEDPPDVLRSMAAVPELQPVSNSQVAEQLFVFLRNNSYFLNNMGPSAHIFLMRNMIEHRNNAQNEELLWKKLLPFSGSRTSRT